MVAIFNPIIASRSLLGVKKMMLTNSLQYQQLKIIMMKKILCKKTLLIGLNHLKKDYHERF